MSFKTYSGSIMGPYHKSSGEPNQDSFAARELPSGAVIAVADGAGSLQHSDVGAHLATQTAVDWLHDLTNAEAREASVREALQAARDALLIHPQRSSIGCTLAVAAISTSGWTIGLVGDVFAVVSTADQHHLYRQIQNSEYHNITTLLTSESFKPLVVSGGGDFLALALSSDGLQNSALQEDEAHPGLWSPLLKLAQAGSLDVESLLRWLDSKEKVEDDTTLVYTVRETV